MTLNISKLRLNSSRSLMKCLLRLKNIWKSPEELNDTLVDLHTEFLKFASFFRKKEEDSDVHLVEKQNCWNTYLYINKNNNKQVIRVLLHLNTVVCVESLFLKLESILLGKQETEILLIIQTFLKQKDGSCNICGLYFFGPYYEIPKRIIDHADYTFFLHESCAKDMKEI